VLVRVEAAGLNPADLGAISGYFKDFMPTVFPIVPAFDLAGTVIAVGDGVEGVAVGDAVFGQTGGPVGQGSLAEKVVASAATLARRPASMDAEFGASLPLPGASALQLVEAADPRPGNVVVVLGATGGIGSIVLQLLRARGALPVAVAQTRNHAYARELGAAETICYLSEDVPARIAATHPEGISAVFDLAGDADLNTRLVPLIRRGGSFASLRRSADEPALAAAGVTGVNLRTQVTAERLERPRGARGRRDHRAPRDHDVRVGPGR
jgi:NADPH:quinone reductase